MNVVRRFIAKLRSLMKIRNGKGPRTAPCGTPYFVVLLSELKPLIETKRDLSLK